jgi:phospholipase/carboxylesterase
MSPQSLSLFHLTRPPTTKSPAERPPLLLLLHGVGSNESDLMGLAPYLDPRFFVISARAPLTLGPGAFGWYHVQFSPQGPSYDPAEAEQGRQAVENFIGEAVSAYGLAPDAVFLMGFSQGAIMSLGVALTKPERVAGVVAMSGRLLPEFAAQAAAPERLAQKPFLVIHGTRDTVLPIAFGREIRDRLGDLPVRLTYREYEMAHEVTEDSIDTVAYWLIDRLEGQK